MKRVLFSLFDQKEAVTYARDLADLGWEIVATKETYDLLREHNIEVRNISDFLQIEDKYPFPPTLHPFLELTLTTPHEQALDFVYIRTYPLSKGNDVGGHTILALAAKGERIAVCEREDMQMVIQQLQQNNNEISSELRQELINKAHTKIIEHYLSLNQNFATAENKQMITGKKTKSLLEGENPYQVPADLLQTGDADRLALSNFKQISGALPCYTNMADFDCILQTLCALTEAFNKFYKKVPHIVVAAKHGNACGAAVDWDAPELACENALLGNPLAIFGGEVIVNFTISEKLAEMLVSSEKRKDLLGEAKWSLDLIIAPDFDSGAVKILEKRKKLKLFKNERLTHPGFSNSRWSYRMVRSGLLRQPPHNYILDFSARDSEVSLPDAHYLDSLIIAWAVAWSSMHGGNEIAIAKNRMLLSAAGGPATINACRTTINRAKKCGHDLGNSVFAADAFFPFTDAPEELIKAGCKYGIVPKGGKNFALVKSYFKKHAVRVFFLPEQFRGFYRH